MQFHCRYAVDPINSAWNKQNWIQTITWQIIKIRGITNNNRQVKYGMINTWTTQIARYASIWILAKKTPHMRPLDENAYAIHTYTCTWKRSTNLRDDMLHASGTIARILDYR